METSLKLQMDVKNNVRDLQNYLLDLNNWEEEMKKKELELNNEKPVESNIPPSRNKIKRNKPENEKIYSNKPKKISAYDYSAWDKFDVDKACAEVDEENCNRGEDKEEQQNKEETSEEEECNSANDIKSSLIDEAFYEKELGNQFVKKEKWDDAIKCYTKAINIDSKNAIYFANRSLCFLKLKNFKAAEVDATVAIQLDKNYIKAYQRRAFARLALGQLAEAKSDYLEVLKIEPKNALARVEITKIDEQLNKESKIIAKVQEKSTFSHKNMFKSETKKVETVKTTDSSVGSKQLPVVKKNDPQISHIDTTVKKEGDSTSRKVEEKGDGDKLTPLQSSKKDIFKPLPEWCSLIHPINIPPHRRSKKPLRKIDIVEVTEDIDVNFQEELNASSPTMRVQEKTVISVKKEDILLKKEEVPSGVPKTLVQFKNHWKALKNNIEDAFSFLEDFPVMNLPQVFGNSLENDFFSELISFLAGNYRERSVEDQAVVIYNYLYNLTRVQRFSVLVLLMSESDKECIRECFNKMNMLELSDKEMDEFSRTYNV